MGHDPGPDGGRPVDRRDALKRIAAVGGAVWVAPALQTINMATASAGTPHETCFTALITPNHCEVPGPSGQGAHCITPVLPSTGACDHVRIISSRAGTSWVIDLGTCRFIEGQVKSGGGSRSCCPIDIPPGTTGVITVPRCASGPHGMLQDISGVEVTFCCDS